MIAAAKALLLATCAIVSPRCRCNVAHGGAASGSSSAADLDADNENSWMLPSFADGTSPTQSVVYITLAALAVVSLAFALRRFCRTDGYSNPSDSANDGGRAIGRKICTNTNQDPNSLMYM